MVGTIRHRCHGYECERCRRGVIVQPECEGDMGLLAYNLWYQAESRQGRQDERDSPSLLVTQLEITSGAQKGIGWKFMDGKQLRIISGFLCLISVTWFLMCLI
ncbi:hypothetical protein TNIN_108821 [Trichonephila inaurata madagascariensis]|uniref:Uncharacterized protein n=1 Tax=Trichonephila inaurata madagascariensis TaxID=2747483 RepID=A0A8X6YDP2_9ARAC|nr:hypothetical protein TNIN_108821 [Trichonephila inaurata madagascariensis]